MGWDPAVEHKTWSPGIIGSAGSSDVILGGPFSMNHKLILGKYSLQSSHGYLNNFLSDSIS